MLNASKPEEKIMMMAGSITADNSPITNVTNATGAGPAIQPQTGDIQPMSALDPFLSLDGQIQKIRQDHDAAIKAVNDQLLATQIELTMTKSALAERTKERDQSERVALKFVTQFGMVAKIFAEVQALALAYETMNGEGEAKKPADQSSVGPANVVTNAISIASLTANAGPDYNQGIVIDGVQAPNPTHDASWQNPDTGKWYDAVTINGNIMSWQERAPTIEFEPSDATIAAIKG